MCKKHNMERNLNLLSGGDTLGTISVKTTYQFEFIC